MATAGSTLVYTVGSQTIYDTEAVVQTSFIPIVTTVTSPDSTSTSTTEGGNTFLTVVTSDGVLVTNTLADSFIAISLIVIPGGTFTSTVAYDTELVTRFETRAVSTIPILTTSIVAVNTPAASQASTPRSSLSSFSPSSPAPSFSTSSAPSSLTSLPSLSSSLSSLSSTSPSPSTFSSSASSRSTSQTSSTTAATVTGTPVRSTKRISSGAIAGIAIGAIIGIVIVAVILFFLQRRRRRSRTTSAHHSVYTVAPATEDKPELPGNHGGLAANKSISNVYATMVKPELEAGSSPTDSTSRRSAPTSPVIYEALSNTNPTRPLSATVLPIQPISMEKQTLQSEHYRHTYPEPTTGQPQPSAFQLRTAAAASAHYPRRPLNEHASPKYFVNGPEPGPDTSRAFHQSHGSAASDTPPDSLSRLRAEHEALMERIRAAEDRERGRRNEDS